MQLGPWSLKEDQLLISLVESFGPSKWNYISTFLPGRIGKQCRERWCNILDPSLEEVEWTQEEDIKLLNMNRVFGNKWSRIAKEYGNRTDNTCWRRWKFLTGNTGKTGLNMNNDITYTTMNKHLVVDKEWVKKRIEENG